MEEEFRFPLRHHVQVGSAFISILLSGLVTDTSAQPSP